MSVFQRTPAWIVPRHDRPFSQLLRWLFRYLPLIQKIDRLRHYLSREVGVIGLRNPWLMRSAEGMPRNLLRAQVKDPVLRQKLTPNYAMGCKRILISNDFYPALTQPNVEVVTDGIAEVTETGITTTDGKHHAVDSIVLCTGFKLTDHPMMGRLYGRDGRSMAEGWSGGAAAYLGMTAPNFPNLFLLSGPYTGTGHTSMVYMLECQFNYVLDAVHVMRDRGLGAIEVRRDAVDAFDREMQAQLVGTVWNSGCASWYLDAHGKNTSLWPTFTWRFHDRTRHFDIAAYDVQERRAALSSAHVAV
jgi:cyclohexanone monooxygenase